MFRTLSFKAKSQSKLKLGDHIASPRKLYTHHGIYLAKNLVINYNSNSNSEIALNNTIMISTLEDFTKDSILYKILHQEDKIFSRITRVKRALRLKGSNKYNLFNNNCEHFVYWCFYDKKYSSQINNLKYEFLAVYKTYKISRNIYQGYKFLRIGAKRTYFGALIYLGDLAYKRYKINNGNLKHTLKDLTHVKVHLDSIKQDLKDIQAGYLSFKKYFRSKKIK